MSDPSIRRKRPSTLHVPHARHDPDTKMVAYLLYQAGKSTLDVSIELDVPWRTVKYWFKRWRKQDAER